jgi:thiamine-monophosphate kinase
MQGRGGEPIHYRPVARLELGQRLREGGIASACIDTSDGAIAALDELMLRSGVGIELNRDIAEVLHPAARSAARLARLPAWTMLAGPHGEYELTFTAPEERSSEVQALGETQDATLIEIGRVVERPGLRIQIDGSQVELDAGEVRGLYRESGGRVAEYIERLVRMVRTTGRLAAGC